VRSIQGSTGLTPRATRSVTTHAMMAAADVAIDRPAGLGGERHARRADDRPLPRPAARRDGTARDLKLETASRTTAFRRALVGADLVAAGAALALISALAEHAVRPASLLTAVLVVVAAKVSRLYDRDEARLRKSTLEEVPALFQLSGLSAFLLFLGDGWLAGHIGRVEILVLWGLLFLFLCIGRSLARRAALALLPPERCLVVGDQHRAEELLDKLAGRGAQVVGFVPLVERRRRRAGTRVAEPCADLEAIIRRTRAHRVIAVPGSHAEAESLLTCVSHAQELGAYVSLLPGMGEVIGSSVEFDHVDGVTLLGVHRFGLTRSSRMIKRAVDVVGATFGLLVVSPLLAVVALAIKLDSPGPVLFRQPRMGRRERPFDMLKFRTMQEDAEARRELLAAMSHAGEGLFKVAGDPRITRVGRVLRRFSLDELPQLINVLRGDMSLVGPRPLVLDEDRRIEGRHRRRLQLSPGITGPWQVLGTAERRVPLRDMVTLDYLYVGNWSLWSDVKILLRTAVHVVRGHGL
jgi:exopolysaccharide biosynthesis polyprenyl glycosylphosphotransferase